MKFRDQLDSMMACSQALEWVGDKTIEQAWETCENTEWMLWFFNKTNIDLIDPLCEMAERVLHLVPEEYRLVCSNAISAAKRRASKDELTAAYNAFGDSIYSHNSNAIYASYAAVLYAAYSDAYASDITDYDVSVSSYNAAADAAANSAANSAAHAVADNSAAYGDANYAAAADAYRKEQKNQCDIFRKYFTIDQVREAFNKLVV